MYTITLVMAGGGALKYKKEKERNFNFLKTNNNFTKFAKKINYPQI
jgi:hypothetical protein